MKTLHKILDYLLAGVENGNYGIIFLVNWITFMMGAVPSAFIFATWFPQVFGTNVWWQIIIILHVYAALVVCTAYIGAWFFYLIASKLPGIDKK